jgi:hypothetical protein
MAVHHRLVMTLVYTVELYIPGELVARHSSQVAR